MEVSVIGAGHVGLVTAACFAQRGHDVLCADCDQNRIDALQAGRLPFFEPGLAPLVEAGRAGGRLRFTSKSAEAVEFGTVVFICVPTPADKDGRADLTCVESVTREIAESLRDYRLVVEKSTVPVNTGESVRALLSRNAPPGVEFEVASNPEFLREGSAVADALNPDRIVLGVESARAEGLLRELYASFEAPILITDTRSAEVIKHASNSFLAFKISYINAVSVICEKAGANVSDVARGMGMDRRIGGQFLQPGIGYGGSCFPKDVAAFGAIARDLGYDFALLREVQRINADAQERFLAKVRAELTGFDGRTVAVLGLAFKPNTDDLRDSVSVSVARRVQDLGARLRAYDPRANGQAKVMLPGATLCHSAYDAARGADCALILTEWEEFRSLDLDRLRSIMRRPVIIDGRNLLDPKEARSRGFSYRSMGRP